MILCCCFCLVRSKFLRMNFCLVQSKSRFLNLNSCRVGYMWMNVLRCCCLLELP